VAVGLVSRSPIAGVAGLLRGMGGMTTIREGAESSRTSPKFQRRVKGTKQADY
jgi:hypothetical protein